MNTKDAIRKPTTRPKPQTSESHELDQMEAQRTEIEAKQDAKREAATKATPAVTAKNPDRPGQIEVKPSRPKMTVRDPITKRKLPDGGGWVRDSSFWRRRILDGGVKLITDR